MRHGTGNRTEGGPQDTRHRTRPLDGAIGQRTGPQSITGQETHDMPMQAIARPGTGPWGMRAYPVSCGVSDVLCMSHGPIPCPAALPYVLWSRSLARIVAAVLDLSKTFCRSGGKQCQNCPRSVRIEVCGYEMEVLDCSQVSPCSVKITRGHGLGHDAQRTMQPDP